MKCVIVKNCKKIIKEQEASRLLSSLGIKTFGSLVDHLQKTKKEYKNLKKQEIHGIFIKMN